MKFRINFLKLNCKVGICQSCKSDFYLMAVSDRFLIGRYADRYNTLDTCLHCYMIGCDSREQYLDSKRSYQK